MSRTIIAAAICLLFSFPCFAAKENDTLLGDKLIVPGVRVGNIYLDKSATYIEKEWGNPEAVTPLTGHIRGKLLFYSSTKGIILITERNRIKAIVVVSPVFETEKGLKVESDSSLIKKNHSNGAAIGEQMIYKNEGISFLVKAGKIKEISINQPIESL